MVAKLATAVTSWTMVFASPLVMRLTATPTMITSTVFHALNLAPSVPELVMTSVPNARLDLPYPTDIVSTASASTMTTTNTTTSTAPANALQIVNATTPEDAAPMAFVRTALPWLPLGPICSTPKTALLATRTVSLAMAHQA